jgi:hypothetical protein
MSEVLTGEELKQKAALALKGAIPLLALYFLPEEGHFAFLGYEGLTVLLKSGAEVEKFLTQKIGQAREVLVKIN